MTTVPLVEASSSLLAHLVEPAVRSLVLGCVAGIVLAAFRVKNSLVRVHVWRAVLCASLAMPLLGWVLPALPFSLPTATLFHAAVESATLLAQPVASALTLPLRAGEIPRSNLQQVVVGERDSTHQRVAQGISAGTAVASIGAFSSDHSLGAKLGWRETIRGLSAEVSRIPWVTLAVGLYMVVALAFLARFFLGLLLSRHLERASQAISDRRAIQELTMCARVAGCRNAPRLAESEVLSVPLTMGVIRPVILFPSRWREWDAAELTAVITHEVSHVARRDALMERTALIHRAIFWFSPLSWWLHRCLGELAEHASDEAALMRGADRTRYAETLLSFFGATEAAQGRVWWQGVSMARVGQAEKRVDRILSWRGAMSRKLTKSFVLILVLCAVPVVYFTAAARPQVGVAPLTPAHPATPQSPALPVAPLLGVSAIANPGPMPQSSVAPLVQPPPTVAAPSPLVVSMPAPLPQDVSPPAPPAPSQTVVAKEKLVVINGVTHVYSLTSTGENEHYAIVSGGSVTLTGTFEDSGHAKSLQSKIQGDFIWFERDGKSYIIRDQETIERAKKLFAAQEELGKRQAKLGEQQAALGEKQSELGKKMSGVRIKIPDLTADIEKLTAKLKELRANETQEDLSEIQGRLAELQSKIGEIQSQGGEEQGKIGEEMGELGRQQGELGEQQGELGRQQAECAERASVEMKRLFYDALARGIARPE